MLNHPTIVVGFRPEAVRPVYLKTQNDTSFQVFQSTLDKYRLVYQQKDWDASDFTSARYLYLTLTVETPIKTVIEGLLKLPFVESAYLKPPDVLPLDDSQIFEP